MRRLAIALVLSSSPGSARADATCPSEARVALDGLGLESDFLRVAELAGAAPASPRLLQRGGARSEPICDPAGTAVPFFVAPDPATALRPQPLRVTTAWNSRFPSGDGDGLLWAGRGVSQIATAGLALRRGPFSASLAPEVTWSQNLAFDTVPTGRPGDLRFANPYYGDGIDLPQRFGAGSFATWGPGQSYLRLDHANVALGVSSENLWVGPGIRNAILMSNAGPGFPHVFLGTSQPADIWIGKAELLLFWGRLERTRFLSAPTHPLLSGLVVTYEPRWVPGLSVGAARMFAQVWKDLTLRNWLAVFEAIDKKGLQGQFGPTGDNPLDNQILSVFGRWAFPEVGFEVYGEWAREDHTWSFATELRQPDRGQAFTIGLQKVYRAPSRLVRVYAETTVLQEMAGFGTPEGAVVYYVHGNDLSFTNRGQLLGAWIGPGGSSQTLAVDVFHRGGRIGGYLERVRRNDEYYWAVVEPTQGNFSHDVEVAAGLRQVLAVGRVQLSWDAAASYRWNRDFLRNEPNVRLVLGLALPFGAAAEPPGAGAAPREASPRTP